MTRSEALKLAQKRYRQRNRAKCNAINLASQRRRYEEVGCVYAKKYHEENPNYAKTYYDNNRNYVGVENMGKQLNTLFMEVQV